jgi:cobalt-zinc-cadmium efflux system membrane fusion protein
MNRVIINKFAGVYIMNNFLGKRSRSLRWSGLCLSVIAIIVLSLVTTGCESGGSVPETTEQKGGTEGEHNEGEHNEGEHKEGEHKEGEHEEGEHGNEIAMTPAGILASGIKVEPVMKGEVSETITAPGRVVPTQNGVAHVGTVIAGRITRLYVSEGSYVSKGTPLAEVESSDIGALKGEYMRARAEVTHRRSALARQEKLVKENIGAQRSLEEARSAYEQGVAAERSADAKLRAAGIKPSSIGSRAFSSRIVLRSPIAGMVARCGVVLGEYIEPSNDAFEVINSSSVWIDAQVPPSAISGLAVGGVGFVRGANGERSSGKIIFISPTVSTESRTVTVRVAVENSSLGLRPEAFVNLEFERSVTGYAIAVPKEAIEQDGRSYFVYKEHEPNTFQRIEVEPGKESGNRVIVNAGLSEGDRIAISGLFYLRSAQQKGELSEHHH